MFPFLGIAYDAAENFSFLGLLTMIAMEKISPIFAAKIVQIFVRELSKFSDLRSIPMPSWGRFDEDFPFLGMDGKN